MVTADTWLRALQPVATRILDATLLEGRHAEPERIAQLAIEEMERTISMGAVVDSVRIQLAAWLLAALEARARESATG
jgi:hypothetical protein